MRPTAFFFDAARVRWRRRSLPLIRLRRQIGVEFSLPPVGPEAGEQEYGAEHEGKASALSMRPASTEETVAKPTKARPGSTQNMIAGFSRLARGASPIPYIRRAFLFIFHIAAASDAQASEQVMPLSSSLAQHLPTARPHVLHTPTATAPSCRKQFMGCFPSPEFCFGNSLCSGRSEGT